METVYKGITISYNEDLVISQKANLEEVIEARFNLLTFVANPIGTPEEILSKVRTLEEALQVAWKFEVNPNYHTYEYGLPGCTCPTMDNQDNARRGSSMRYLSENCPYHKL